MLVASLINKQKKEMMPRTRIELARLKDTGF